VFFVLPRSLCIQCVGLTATLTAMFLGVISASASPKDYLTLTPIIDADASSDDRALATSNINVVAIKQGALQAYNFNDRRSRATERPPRCLTSTDQLPRVELRVDFHDHIRQSIG